MQDKPGVVQERTESVEPPGSGAIRNIGLCRVSPGSPGDSCAGKSMVGPSKPTPGRPDTSAQGLLP